MKYEQLASDIIYGAGGGENIESVIHRATRLRFTLKQSASADKDKVNNLDGVIAAVESGGQFQVAKAKENGVSLSIKTSDF